MTITNTPAIKVLMICMGNICRSPLAHGVLQHLVAEANLQDKILVDSAGTHFYHIGCSPDERSIAVADSFGLDISTQKARQLIPADFETFDYLIVMDKRNLRDAKSMAPTPAHAEKLSLFMSYSQDAFTETDIPDPYHDGDDGFKHVYNLVASASKGFLATLRQERGL